MSASGCRQQRQRSCQEGRISSRVGRGSRKEGRVAVMEAGVKEVAV